MGVFAAGTVLGGRYEIVRQLGAGGMARVYLAHDPKLGRDVAVKVLAERYANDPTFVERFRREASAAAGLSHPSIVSVFDRGEAEGTYYIVMEFLPGPDLKQIIRGRGTLSPLESVDNALQILSALAVAHRRDVIHRDIKPQNVMLAGDGLLKVTDFGIARAGAQSDMTEAGSVIGTAQYLSPEQARGDEVTPASDCYAVGIVLYEMLTGKVPFDGERPLTVAMKQINEPPVPPSTYEPGIPPKLERAILTALAKRPSERYRTADEFTRALLDVRADLEGATGATGVLGGATGPITGATRVFETPTESTRITPPRPPRPPSPPIEGPPRRRKRGLLVAAALVVLAIIGVAAFMFSSGNNGPKTVVVPSLVGQSGSVASQTLSDLKLVPQTKAVTSEVSQRGNVISTTPGADVKVKEGDTVTLSIGKGPDDVAVPKVVDESEADARALLAQKGFTDVTPTPAASDTVITGNVISQDPAAGKQVQPNTPIALVISSGPEQVPVPDLRGKTLDASGNQRLSDAGLTLGTTTERPNGNFAEGTVLEQDPPAKMKVDKGTPVNVVIAVAPADVGIPNVAGLDEETARAKLSDNGFENVDTTEQESLDPAGTVIATSPEEGTPVASGTLITLILSLGPAATTTPPIPVTPAPTVTTP
jgi:eukaryotic-like serine/threonine-protein kinase